MGLASVRVIHTLPAVHIEACGPCYSVPRLCESLIAAGVPTKLAVLDWVPGTKAPPYVERFPPGFGPGWLGRSPAMARWLVECVRNGKVQVIYSHGLWMMPNVYPGWAKKVGDVRLIVSPLGTLSEWALNHYAVRKRVFWVFLQRQTLERADCFHVTAESGLEDIRRLGFRQPVAVLPNGIDVPSYDKPVPGARCRLLYLGGIHKKRDRPAAPDLWVSWLAIQLTKVLSPKVPAAMPCHDSSPRGVEPCSS